MKDERAAGRGGTSSRRGPAATSSTVAIAALLAPAAIVSVVLLVGCASFRVESAWVGTRAGGAPQRAAGAVESSSPNNGPPLRIEIGREEAHGAAAATEAQSVRMSGGPLLGAVIHGIAQREVRGGWKISLISLHWFNNWHNGWTEATFVVDGRFDLERRGAAYRILVESAPEIDGPSAATIRYFDQYLGGKAALEQFTDRWDRIEAYANFLRSRYGDAWPRSERSLERLLFPEIYGYRTPPAARHASVEGDGVRWNSDYTRAVFPKELQPIRDSGTMLRDWEESPGLFQLAFRWKSLWATDIQADLFDSVRP